MAAGFTGVVTYYVTATTERKPPVRPYFVLLTLMAVGAAIWWFNQDRSKPTTNPPVNDARERKADRNSPGRAPPASGRSGSRPPHARSNVASRGGAASLRGRTTSMAPRTPFLLLVLGLLGGGLICLVVLNTTFASASFKIATLQRSVADELVQQKAMQAQIAQECRQRESEGLPNLLLCGSTADRQQPRPAEISPLYRDVPSFDHSLVVRTEDEGVAKLGALADLLKRRTMAEVQRRAGQGRSAMPA